MAMVRNESVARMVMFLCFGTALFSLAVHWRITATQGQFEQPAAAAGNRHEGIDGNLEATSVGASTPSESTFNKTTSNDFTPNLSATASQNPGTSELLPKIRSVIPGLRQNSQTSPTEVVVNLSDRRTYVYKGDQVIASYPIAIGKTGWETPTGSFRVTNMQHDPIWRHPITGKIFPSGADSPLGERWIGFWSDGRNEIGFHGTPDTHLLGAAISHGCLRMRNEDVRLLYEQVGVGTLVSVRE
jgi:lipoprotein-anchoring transpeptidase ErfK/SrfK